MSRLYAALSLLVVLGITHFYAYQKGKESVFKGIISGQAVYQEKQEERAKEDVKEATKATEHVVNVRHRTAERTQKLQPVQSPELTDEQLALLRQIAKESE